MRFLRYAKCPVNRPCWGPGGVWLPGLLYIWDPFLYPEAIKILSLGAIGSFSKGSLEFILDDGAQRARL
jgi:hypothetical protein